MSTDFESAFLRIVADNFSPDDNLPAFPTTSHYNREWMTHERVSDDVPVRPVTRLSYPLVKLPYASGDSWVSPHTGRRYSVGETIDDSDMGHPSQHNATWEHPGNPNPFRSYPPPFRFKQLEGDDDS